MLAFEMFQEVGILGQVLENAVGGVVIKEIASGVDLYEETRDLHAAFPGLAIAELGGTNFVRQKLQSLEGLDIYPRHRGLEGKEVGWLGGEDLAALRW